MMDEPDVGVRRGISSASLFNFAVREATCGGQVRRGVIEYRI